MYKMNCEKCGNNLKSSIVDKYILRFTCTSCDFDTHKKCRSCDKIFKSDYNYCYNCFLKWEQNNKKQKIVFIEDDDD